MEKNRAVSYVALNAGDTLIAPIPPLKSSSLVARTDNALTNQQFPILPYFTSFAEAPSSINIGF